MIYVVFGVVLLIITFVIFVGAILSYRQTKANLVEDTDSSLMTFPLRYNSSIDVYETTIPLGSQKYTCIVDTGSDPCLVQANSVGNPGGIRDQRPIGTLLSPQIRRIDFVGSQVTRYQLYSTTVGDWPVTVGVVLDSSINQGVPRNVLGLQPGGEDSFLSSLKERGNVFIDFSHDKLQLGTSSALRQHLARDSSKTEVPLSVTEGHSLTEVKEILFDDKPVKGVTRVLWDSGTTLSYLNDVGDVSLGSVTTVTIVFTTGARLQYRVPPQSVKKKVLPVKDCLLIGNIWMRQYDMAFLYTEGLLLISDL